MNDLRIVPAALAINEMAVKGLINAAGDVLTESTPVTPYRKGELRQKRRVVPQAWGAIIQWTARHAGAQNAGQARGRVFRQYTTPGTGKDFVKYGLDRVLPKLLGYMK